MRGRDRGACSPGEQVDARIGAYPVLQPQARAGRQGSPVGYFKVALHTNGSGATNCRETLKLVALILEVPEEDLAEQTLKNAQEVFASL